MVFQCPSMVWFWWGLSPLLADSSFLQCAHKDFPRWMCVEKDHSLFLVLYCHHSYEKSTLITSFNINYLLKVLSPNRLEVGLQHMNFERTQSVHSILPLVPPNSYLSHTEYVHVIPTAPTHSSINCKVHSLLKISSWGFPGGPVVKNMPSSAVYVGSVPGWGTKIPHAMGQVSPWVATKTQHG